jgi:hypothetical protein
MEHVKQIKQKSSRDIALELFCFGAEGQNFMRLRRTSCRHGDFQAKFLKLNKRCDYKQLILFQYFD